MSIPVQYLSFKAAGIYRLVYDKSTVLGVDAEILRLVVGYSEQGPFNTPVYIKSLSDFTTVFGGISKKLEKRGIYFHRLALLALESGPIIALNLKKFSGEVVEGISMNPSDTTATKNTLLVEDIYDTSRFWSLDAQQLNNIYIATEQSDGTYEASTTLQFGKDKYIKIAATSIKTLSHSFFIRPATGNQVAQYKMTIADWYKSTGEEMPEYFEGYENTLLSDYFAEIYVFKGEFVPSQVLASETLLKYFDGYMDGDELKVKLKSYIKNSFDDNVDTLDALFLESAALPVGHYMGSLIPYFKTSQGAYASLDIIFNNDVDSHHMMMAFDEDLLENSDASLINLSGTDIFSGDANSIKSKLDEIYKGEGTSSALCNTNATINSSKIQVTVDDETGEVTFVSFDLNKDSVGDDADNTDTTLYGSDSVVFCELKEQVKNDDAKVDIDLDESDDDEEGSGTTTSIDVIDVIFNAIKASLLATYTDESELLRETYKKYVEIVPAELRMAAQDCRIIAANNSLVSMFNVGDSVVKSPSTTSSDNTSTVLVQAVGSFDFDDTMYSYIKTSGLVNEVEEGNSTYIVRIDGSLNGEIGTLCPIYLKGYTFNNPKPTDNTGKLSSEMYDKLTWQKEILSTLTEYKGLRTGLLSKSDIDYRYIVDTFETFVDSSAKKILSYLAKEKQSCFAILNFPSVKTFMNCKYTSFKSQKGIFNVQYVVDGYNKKKSAAVKFSLPSDSEGASFCAFYTPLKFSDGTLTTIVPSAGLVSNLFMEKYLSRQPYYIIAGPNYGLIIETGLVGPDYNYSQDELQIIEPFGVNCMVYRPGFGTFINANLTAKQTPVSALSKVNVRELVIYLQDEIEKVLQSYQWDFNTVQTRQAIKDKADQICERVKATGGIYAYLNVMDTSNNTNEIIDNEMSVLSTHIEAGRGCGKMIQELTLYGTGQLSATITE